MTRHVDKLGQQQAKVLQPSTMRFDTAAPSAEGSKVQDAVWPRRSPRSAGAVGAPGEPWSTLPAPAMRRASPSGAATAVV